MRDETRSESPQQEDDLTVIELIKGGRDEPRAIGLGPFSQPVIVPERDWIQGPALHDKHALPFIQEGLVLYAHLMSNPLVNLGLLLRRQLAVRFGEQTERL